MDSTLELLKRLNEHGVEYVLVGGLAGTAHGSALVTEDVDLCASLSEENVRRLWAALLGIHPRWRMSPGKPPVPPDPAAVMGYKNLYLLTDLGQLDVLSEISGVGTFADVERRSVRISLGGIACRVLELDALIEAKRALGRPKDLQAAAELEAVRQKLRRIDKKDLGDTP